MLRQAPTVSTGRAGRLLTIDLARTTALLGMVVFHFARDLELFGIVPHGTTLSGGWAVFARLVAGTFIFLSGFSLILAPGKSFRPMAWLKRTSVIVAAALLVSAATYFAFPESFIFFGIIHAIAFFALLGPLLLRLPAWGLVAGAFGVLAVNALHDRSLFDTVYLAWTGLGATVPASFDFIPVFPWLAAYLLGMAVARVLPLTWLAVIPPKPFWETLSVPGRYSLSIYLLHQPLLLMIVWLAFKAL